MVALVTDYCKHGDINEFIERNHKSPQQFRKYRDSWNKKTTDKPMFVLFETTSKCNLRCTMCVQSVGYEQTERMQDQLFLKSIKEISDLRIPAVAMNQINEPLLDKKIYDKIKIVSEVDSVVDIHMNTNAVLLNRSNSEKILNSNLTRLLLALMDTQKMFLKKLEIEQNMIKFLIT